MKRMKYTEIMKLITNKRVDTNNLWIEDDNGVKWFWNGENFATGIHEWDKSAPVVYLSDKYNIVEIYSMSFNILKMTDLYKQTNKLSIEDIIDKFSENKNPVKLINNSGEIWDFVPLDKSIVNKDGENILDCYDEKQISMMDFEEMWVTPVHEEWGKDRILDHLTSEISNIRESLEKAEVYLKMIKDMIS